LQIDFAGIGNRIVALNVPRRNYTSLVAGAEGTIFYGEAVPNQQGVTVHRYALEERKAQPFLVGVQFYTLSADGKKLLYRAGGGGPGGPGGPGGRGAATWGIVDATARTAPKVGDGRLNTSALRMRVDPRAEWRQMFVEGWRFQRDFLYVPNTHGADWQQVRAMYEPWVEHVRHRSDLTYLLDVMGAELSVGHSFVRGGDLPDIDEVSVGLLGADLEIHEGRYRIKRIYRGDPWTPEMRAPLAAPGLRVAEGDYILEVNGVELRAPENPYRLFENTANRQTLLRVNRRPTREGSWVITVVPVASESGLRTHAWVEENRRKVDELSGGRLAYVWLPNTAQGGYTSFNREYFAQQDKQGAVIDERFNSGGSAADYIVDIMARRLHGYFNNAVADRRPFTSPGAGIWGPKVMIVNEMAGSGGDLLPYMFRFLGIGPLVGTRTWGGLVGTWDTPPLIDGGVMIAPRGGFFNLDGEWDVENEGVAPDIEVEMTPAEVIAGRDPQLEAAVKEALRLLEANPVRLREEPPPPNKWRRPGVASSER
jgi:tricorn protease